MKIAVASDHAGYEMPEDGDGPPYKPAIIAHLKEQGHEVVDCGPYGPESVDYPDYAAKVCEAILRGEAERGVLLCGTGIGISIGANRFPPIRAAVCVTADMATLAREHNDANVLCMGRRVLKLDQCKEFIDIFLTTPFSGVDRHIRRVEKLGALPSK